MVILIPLFIAIFTFVCTYLIVGAILTVLIVCSFGHFGRRVDYWLGDNVGTLTLIITIVLEVLWYLKIFSWF
ncbi:MAG: hypothetical protein ACRC92_27305 [Peptostreptococcaceae bacterium]